MPDDATITSLRKRISDLEAEVTSLREALRSSEASSQKNRLEVNGIHLAWCPDEGRCTFEGIPVAMMWIDTTLASLFSGMQAMVGTRRFSLALQSEGRKSVAADWAVIDQFERFEDGFKALSNIAAVAGWGRWELLSLDRDAKRCVVRTRDSWEGLFQRTLGVRWGSSMVAGKLAGCMGRLFGENCWAEQTRFLADGDDCDEFEIMPSMRSVEQEIENLMSTDEASRADMAVALIRLQKEVEIRTTVERQLREIQADLASRVSKRTAELAAINEQLRRSEERFRSIVESSPMGIHTFEMDANGQLFLRSANPAASVITGFDNAALIGQPIHNVIPSLAETDIPEQLRRVCLTGEPWQANQVEYQEGKDVGYYESYGFKTGARTIAVLFLNVTEQVIARREKEILAAELNRSKKMEALGLLAGGVAHDLNNILTGLVGYPELLATMMPEDSPMQKPLKLIESSGARASAVVQDLLTIARGAASERITLSVNDIVFEYLQSPEFESLQTRYPEVEVVPQPAADLLGTKGSSVHIRKVIMNLITNAIEAIPGRGRVTITTANRYIDEPMSGYDSVKVGEYVVLSVTDTGEGISPEDLEHIFEPFYTRKRMGRSGTGLGLAVVWNCVKDHQGYIDISSSGEGTCINIYLGATRESPERMHDHGEQHIRGCGQTILIIDDEPSQREVTGEILNWLGYDAHVVADGIAACDFIRTHKVDMVVLDMIMPQSINGRETYQRLREIQPGLPAIIVSGYARNNDVIETQAMGAGAFLKKPFTMTQLSRVVHEELNRSRSSAVPSD